MKPIFVLLMLLPLAACAGQTGGGGGLFGGGNRAGTAPVDPAIEPAVEETELTAEAGGGGAPEGDGTFVGFTVASLGDAGRAGLWLETPLVTEEGPGRVVSESGAQLLLTLIPSGGERGSGSRMSLAAYQALGIPLTALPTVTVISDA